MKINQLVRPMQQIIFGVCGQLKSLFAYRTLPLCFFLLVTLSACHLFRLQPTTASRSSTNLKIDTETYHRSYVRQVVKLARMYTGTPYQSGGNTSDGMDCSGLIFAVFNTVGLPVPRISWQQSEIGYEVEPEVIEPGDLVFFVPDKGKAGYVSHTGIVTEVRSESEILFIHASSSRGVREDNLFSDYFKGRFVKAVRPF